MNEHSILVIDDDDRLRAILCSLIEQAGYSTRAVANGLEAGELLATETFSLVLTDIFMPEKDGYLVIRDLHKANPELPIIAMSGGVIPRGGHLKLAQLFGARAILRKPFSDKQLLSTIKSLLG